MTVAGKGGVAVGGVAIGPDLQRSVGVIGQELLAWMVDKLRGQGDRSVDVGDGVSVAIKEFAVSTGLAAD